MYVIVDCVSRLETQTNNPLFTLKSVSEYVATASRPTLVPHHSGSHPRALTTPSGDIQLPLAEL